MRLALKILRSSLLSSLFSLLFGVSVHLSADDTSLSFSSSSSLISSSFFLPDEDEVFGTFINTFFSSIFGVYAGLMNLSLCVSELVGKS